MAINGKNERAIDVESFTCIESTPESKLSSHEAIDVEVGSSKGVSQACRIEYVEQLRSSSDVISDRQTSANSIMPRH